MTGDGVDVRIEVIDPIRAAEMLEHNRHNRSLRVPIVETYAQDIASGKWDFNGDPIRFAKDGTLIDGQHRLHAIVAAGRPVKMVVMRGLQRDQQLTMDAGLKRNLADALKLRGEKNATQLATHLRAIVQWEFSRQHGQARPTLASTLEFLDKNTWVRDGVDVTRRVYMATRLSMAVQGPLWYRFTLIDPNDCRAFFDRLASDEGHAKGEPIYRLRRVLMHEANGLPRTTQLPARHTTGLIIKAWNKFRTGEECHGLTFIAGGANPEPMPEPR